MPQCLSSRLKCRFDLSCRTCRFKRSSWSVQSMTHWSTKLTVSVPRSCTAWAWISQETRHGLQSAASNPNFAPRRQAIRSRGDGRRLPQTRSADGAFRSRRQSVDFSNKSWNTVLEPFGFITAPRRPHQRIGSVHAPTLTDAMLCSVQANTCPAQSGQRNSSPTNLRMWSNKTRGIPWCSAVRFRTRSRTRRAPNRRSTLYWRV